MQDLGTKLHPVKKLQLWEAVKKTIFSKMNNDIITPERADEILSNIKPKIIEVRSPEQAKELYTAMPQIAAELTPVSDTFKIQEAETLDQMLTLLLDIIIEKGDLDLASNLMEEIKKSNNHSDLIQILQNKYPSEFEICSKRFEQKFN